MGSNDGGEEPRGERRSADIPESGTPIPPLRLDTQPSLASLTDDCPTPIHFHRGSLFFLDMGYQGERDKVGGAAAVAGFRWGTRGGPRVPFLTTHAVGAGQNWTLGE